MMTEQEQMEKLRRFFHWHGEIGRFAFFIEGIKRGVIIVALMLLTFGINLLYGTSANYEAFRSAENEPLVAVASFILFTPLYIRRLRDIGISLWWIVPFEALYLLPAPTASTDLYALYVLLVQFPYFCWGIFLQFKPGKTHRDFLRSRTHA